MRPGPDGAPTKRLHQRRTPLHLDQLMDRAAHIARTEGLARMSMRRIAESLEIQAMSLYHYVPSKAALISLMADRSAAQALSDSHHDTGPWNQQIVGLLEGLYRAGIDNSALVAVLATLPWRVAPTETPDKDNAVTVLLARLQAHLQQAPLSSGDTAAAYRALLAIVTGFLAGAAASLAYDLSDELTRTLTAYLQGLSNPPP